MNKELKERIHLKLIEFPELRDNDNELQCQIWREDISLITNISFFHIEFSQFYGLYADGKLSSAESIRRYRQMIQEKHPELRGKNYLKRHKFAEEVKEEIINSK